MSRHERDRFVAAAFEEQVLNHLGLRFEAHAAHQLHVEVATTRAHAADVEREPGLRRHQAVLDVVGDLAAHRVDADFETRLGAA